MTSFSTYHQVSLMPTTADGTSLGNCTVNFVEAGNPFLPTIIMYHGFPSSSTQFRDTIPLLSDAYHVLAPDLPGFGLTTVPDNFTYSFDNLAAVTGAWLDSQDLIDYSIYIFDYGAPVGLRLAVERPQQVKAIVSQNGNAYNAGFGQQFWEPIFNLWNSSDSIAARNALKKDALSLTAAQSQYETGTPDNDKQLIDPALTWHNDYYSNLQGPKKKQHQLNLFYDYRTNPQTYYSIFQEYFRTSKVPILAVWGRGDPSFIPAGAYAFQQDSPDAQVVLLSTGHFALKTQRWEVVRLMKNFLTRIGF